MAGKHAGRGIGSGQKTAGKFTQAQEFVEKRQQLAAAGAEKAVQDVKKAAEAAKSAAAELPKKVKEAGEGLKTVVEKTAEQFSSKQKDPEKDAEKLAVKAETKETGKAAAETENLKTGGESVVKKAGRGSAGVKRAAAKTEENTVKRPGRKPVEKQAEKELKTKLVFQIDGWDLDADAILERVKKDAAEKCGKVKKLDVYVNVYEHKAYYDVDGVHEENYKIEL